MSVYEPPEVEAFRRKVEAVHQRHTRNPVVLSRREARHVFTYIDQLERALKAAKPASEGA